MVRSSMATRERPLASKRDSTSPTSPRRTVSGLRRTRVRWVDGWLMRRTLPSSERVRAAAYVVRDRPGRVDVRDGLAGDQPERHVTAPHPGCDVLRLVDRAA